MDARGYLMSKKATRDKSILQEKMFAEYIDGRVNPNSGATWHTKGDVMDAHTLFECKTHMAPRQSHSIKRDELKKNEREALGERKQFSAYVFDFGDTTIPETYVVLPAKDFKELYDCYKEQVEEDYE